MKLKTILEKRLSHQYRGMDYGSKILVIQFLKGITYGLFAHFILKVIFDLYDINNDDDDDDPEGGLMSPVYMGA